MFISPINPVDSLEQLKTTETQALSQGGTSTLPFQSLFQDALNNVGETNAAMQEEANKVVTGETDNLHDVTIASTKASMALDLFVSLRNKALDSYNEIMRINL